MPDKFIDSRPAGALGTNLRHLHVLCAVAEAGSIAHAAEGLYRVSSAVARSISELETVLGVPLFERRSRGMVINRYGDLSLIHI